jgi:hypothetical protein
VMLLNTDVVESAVR